MSEGLILGVAGIALIVVLAAAAIIGSVTSSWSDEKREKYGLGPKGQGRDW